MLRNVGKLRATALLISAVLLCVAGIIAAITLTDAGARLNALGGAIFFGAAIPLFALRTKEAYRQQLDLPPPNPQSIVEFRTSLSETVAMLIGAIGFVIGGYILTRTSTDTSVAYWVGWICVALFGLCIAALFVRYVRQGYSLRLSPAGLDYSPFKVGTIAWQDIRTINVSPVLRRQAISLELIDQEKYFARGYPQRKTSEALARRFNISPFCLSAELIGATTDEVLDAIKLRHRAFHS